MSPVYRRVVERIQKYKYVPLTLGDTRQQYVLPKHIQPKQLYAHAAFNLMELTPEKLFKCEVKTGWFGLGLRHADGCGCVENVARVWQI